MISIIKSLNLTPGARRSITILFVFGLWSTLILSLQAGDIRSITNPGSPVGLFHGLRAALPLGAGALALGLILIKLYRRQPERDLLFGPLGLTALYGLVGIAAVVLSVDRTVSLYWAGAYLSVPLVLWAIVWGNDSLDLIHRVANFNYLVVIIGVMALFVTALLYLDFGSIILSPQSWLKCDLNTSFHGQSWLKLTGGVLRPTGVGRYAAIAGIIAISSLWQRRWKSIWVLVLAVSLSLLLTSGARNAFVGFAAATALVIVMQGGWKAALVSAFAAILVAVVIWQTDMHQGFLEKCLRVFTTEPAEATSAQATLQQEISNTPALVPTLKPARSSEQERVTPPLSIAPEAAQPAASSSQASGQDRASAQPASTLEAGASVQDPSRVFGQDQASAQPASTLEAGPLGPAKSLAPRQGEIAPGDSGESGLSQPSSSKTGKRTVVNPNLVTLSGRTLVWVQGWGLFKLSPTIGLGFQGDRLLAGTHAHNTLLHALIQTGLLGTIPLIAAFSLSWIYLVNCLRNRERLPVVYKLALIQSGGILTFLSVRMLTESSGAFFGVDWLILAPLLLFLQALNRSRRSEAQPA